MKVISKAEILETTIKTKRDGFCTKCNKDAVKKAVSEAKEFDAIPLDCIKQIRDELETYIEPANGMWSEGYNSGINKGLELIDELIKKSEN